MKSITALATVLLAALLTGCSTTTITPAGANNPTPATTTAQTSAAKYGDTATFSDGLKATVTAHTIKASQYAYGAIDGRIVVITVKLTNPTKTAINAGLVIPEVTAGTNGTSAEVASDEAIHMNSIGNLLPGETQTEEMGYGVATKDLATVRVELGSPDLASANAVFKGAVK